MTSLDVETRPHGTSLDAGYDKRLMVTAGRASRQLGQRIASKLGVELTDPGLKTFTDGEVYSNLWQLTFAPDGRCTRFVEWYVLHPRD